MNCPFYFSIYLSISLPIYQSLNQYIWLHQSLLIKVFATVKIPSTSVRDAYLAYIDILNKLELFSYANDIIMHSDDEYISKFGMSNVIIYSSCSQCKKEVLEKDTSVSSTPLPSSAASSSDTLINQAKGKVANGLKKRPDDDKDPSTKRSSRRPWCVKCNSSTSICAIW
jgi:hypothetical protein